MRLRLRRYHDTDQGCWFFDIDLKRDSRNSGPGYYVERDGAAGSLKLLNDDFYPKDSPWDAVVLCVEQEDSQAPVLEKYRVDL